MRHLVIVVMLVCLQFNDVRCVPLSKLYPYHDKLDIKLSRGDDVNSRVVRLTTDFPFLGMKHRSLIVNTNGAIFFGKVMEEFSEKPLPWKSFSAVAPFWSDIDTTKGGYISYRHFNDSEVLTQTSRDITRMFSLQSPLTPKFVLIATWFNVTFFGAKKAGIQKRNTFQTVLVTDGNSSYVILNYNDLEWLAGANNGGNVNTGLGGKAAQVGFNAGDGKHYYAVTGSGTPEVLNLTQHSNVGSTGQYAFRVDNQVIDECLTSPCSHGNCTKQTNGYRCKCNYGYEGKHCDKDINDCAGDPCHNGTCVDLVGDFLCRCHSGYTGRNCSEEITGCKTHTCRYGNCVTSTTTGYKCVCYSGYVGDYCNIALVNIYIGVGVLSGLVLIIAVVATSTLCFRSKAEREPLLKKTNLD